MRILATKEHKQAVIQSLQEAHDRTKQARGTQYGPLTLEEMEKYLAFLNGEEEDPIELFLQGKCPKCKVNLVYEVDCFCPQCSEEWGGDKVLKEFYREATFTPLTGVK